MIIHQTFNFLVFLYILQGCKKMTWPEHSNVTKKKNSKVLKKKGPQLYYVPSGYLFLPIGPLLYNNCQIYEHCDAPCAWNNYSKGKRKKSAGGDWWPLGRDILLFTILPLKNKTKKPYNIIFTRAYTGCHTRAVFLSLPQN